MGLGESMSSFSGRSGRVGSTTVATIDGQEAAASWPGDAVVKIDVEGAEYRLLPRLRPYLTAHQPTMVLSVHGYDLRASLAGWPSPIRRVINHARHAARCRSVAVGNRRVRQRTGQRSRPAAVASGGTPLSALVLRMWERELLLERT